MSNEKGENFRRNERHPSSADDDQLIVVEGEERPIVFEGDGSQPTDDLEEVPYLEEDAEQEHPVAATVAQPPPVRRPEPPPAVRRLNEDNDPWQRNTDDDIWQRNTDDDIWQRNTDDDDAWRRTAVAERPMPTRRDEPPIPVIAEPKPGGGGRRRKKLLLVLGGIVVGALLLGMVFNALSAGSSKTNPQTVTVAATPTATTSISDLPASTSGALILINPGVVSQGAMLNVIGSGFQPNAPVELEVMTQTSSKVLASASVKADKNGNFVGASLTVPTTLSAGNFIVAAKAGKKTANAVGTVAGGAPQVKLGKMVSKPGDVVGVDAHGFGPGEPINVYWNSMTGKPVAVLQADSGGGVGLASVRVPFGIVGTNTFLFVGTKSQSLAATNILLLSLYPSVAPSSYMVRADNTLSFSGKGFGPGERVFAFLGDQNGVPVAVIQTNANGAFSGAGNIDVPFTMKGKQKVIFLGEQSRTTSTVAFTVQPYMPHAQASTYGGYPGTTVTFYGAGFARNEVVHVFVGSTQNSAGTMVSCFRTDATGNANAAGSYLVPGDAQTGALTFALTGTKSGSTATASMNIAAAPGPVNVPAQPPFTCPLDANP